MNFPETAMRIKKALEINDMNAQTLAEKSGVAKASISHYVNGRNEPSNISALKMGKVLGVNPMWLMGYDEPMIKTKTLDLSDFSEDQIARILSYAAFLKAGEGK